MNTDRRWLASFLLLTATLAPAQTINIDASAPGKPFPHFWERVFGSGRAILSLRESYRNDLRATKAVTGMEYIRFHAIFHDEVGLYDETKDGQPIYNFSYVDQIYDGLRQNGVRPFVELSFMPRKLAASDKPHAFWYKPLPNPPKDYARWEELVRRFTEHLVDRYGIEEVAQWYFEVWNEPNIDFWTGDPREASYYELYDHAARAVKSVSPRLRVGGPATAAAAWVDRFIQHCVDSKTPVDFVSTHVYGNDTAKDVFGTDEQIPRSAMVARAVKKVYDQVKASPRPDLPIHWSEFNAAYKPQEGVTDAPFIGPWLANTIRMADGFAATMSYWTFSDVFEEGGVVKSPFYGGFGLLAAGGIPKASYNAFALLHRLGIERIPSDSDSAIVTRRADGTLAIAVWNYAPPIADGGGGSPRTITLSFTGLMARQVRITRVDRDHGSSLTAWEAMGRPDSPTLQQQRELKQAGKMAAPEVRELPGANLAAKQSPARLTLTLQPQCLALVEIQR